MTHSTPGWRASDSKLPKALEGTAGGLALSSALRDSAETLWEGAAIRVPVAAWTSEAASALRSAAQQGHLVRGLSLIQTTLERQARGLAIADARIGAERGVRVSRLVLVSRDGTERFYRQVERLVVAHGARLLAIRIEADAAELGSVIPQASGVVRALLVEHKSSVAHVLSALYLQGDPLSSESSATRRSRSSP